MFKYFLSLLIVLFLTQCRSKTLIQQFQICDSSNIIVGKQNWNGPKDCSAEINLYKLEKGMEVQLEVSDDELFENIKNPNKSDAIELYFDFRPLRKKIINQYMKGVMQIIVRPGFKTHKDQVIFYPNNYQTFVPNTLVRTHWGKNHYSVNVYLPFDQLQQIHYLPCTFFAFDVSIIDVDQDSLITNLCWHSKKDINWIYPDNFGTIKWKMDE